MLQDITSVLGVGAWLNAMCVLTCAGSAAPLVSGQAWVMQSGMHINALRDERVREPCGTQQITCIYTLNDITSAFFM